MERLMILGLSILNTIKPQGKCFQHSLIGDFTMNDDTFNMEIRQYLKKVGITSQREIEHAVLKAIENGSLNGRETFEVRMTLSVPALAIKHEIVGQIALEE